MKKIILILVLCLFLISCNQKETIQENKEVIVEDNEVKMTDFEGCYQNCWMQFCFKQETVDCFDNCVDREKCGDTNQCLVECDEECGGFSCSEQQKYDKCLEDCMPLYSEENYK